jgi:hypothetical protein
MNGEAPSGDLDMRLCEALGDAFQRVALAAEAGLRHAVVDDAAGAVHALNVVTAHVRAARGAVLDTNAIKSKRGDADAAL